MTIDILLDNSHDLVLVNGDLVLTSREQITRQKLKQVLQLFKGEWFLNTDAGIPYFEEILGKNASVSRIETLFIRAIQGIEEVVEILKLDITEDKATRAITVDLVVKDGENNTIEVTI